jgi:hypothetical protein
MPLTADAICKPDSRNLFAHDVIAVSWPPLLSWRRGIGQYERAAFVIITQGQYTTKLVSKAMTAKARK